MTTLRAGRTPPLSNHASAPQRRLRTIRAFLVALLVCSLARHDLIAAEAPVDANGTTLVPSFALPESSLLSDEARAVLKELREAKGHQPAPVAPEESSDPVIMAGIRTKEAQAYAVGPEHQWLLDRFNVEVTTREMGGVRTETFVPKDGIAPANRDRVLINLHGGGFRAGSRVISHIESIPTASVGKIKVVSVDYRMGPEYAFPAASEDVAAVYRELLKVYKPKNIGIFGSSAGGLLTAETIAWLQKEKLPLPGAVGMLAGGATYYQDGDAAQFSAVLSGFPLEPIATHPYFKAVDAQNPLAFPARSAEVLAKFPPSLLIASTRDIALSSVIYTHSRLVHLGVEAELHVWEGLPHCFYDGFPQMPESQDARDIIVRFFERHLGK